MLLRGIINNTLQCNSGEHNFPNSSSPGKWGFRDGHFPHVGDAIPTFHDSWAMMKKTVLKCWVKSQFLSEDQVEFAKTLIAQQCGSSDTSTISFPIVQDEAQEECLIT